MTEHTTDQLESKEFYELMQQYRHTPITEQKLTSEAFEEVKKFIESNFLPKQVVEEAIGEDEPTSDWEMDFERGRNDLRRKLRNTLGLGETHNE